MEAIVTKGLTKRYKDLTAVDHLDLSIRKGELFALLGVNGAGKTTTIRMLCGLVKPDEGDALILGHSVKTDLASVKQSIAVSPQETAVAANLTVEENLSLICSICGSTKQQTATKIADMLQKLKLTAVKHKRAGKLSGGYMRRLSIAMALISEPKVLFLDEPTLGLDVLARAELWELIRGLKGEVSMILTTHYMEEAKALSDRIGIMAGGRLLTVGTAREIMDKTGKDDFEAAFIQTVKEAEV